eukprot:1990564-Rhodomonas_salina.1
MKEKISALKNRRKRERVNLLLTAAMQGDVPKLNSLVTTNVTVNAVDPNKRTALHVAASEGHTDMTAPTRCPVLAYASSVCCCADATRCPVLREGIGGRRSRTCWKCERMSR